MAGIDYQTLYSLQDKVLSIVFSTEREFYLTGGTCLSRFYQEKRYSDDLDFFTNNSPRFHFAVKNIYSALKDELEITTETEAKDFIRYRVENTLQVDFVNDSAARFKEPVILENNYIIDNIENILSNKLTAVIGRDNPKDVFDIYLIAKNYSFSWKEILESAHRKAVFSDDELIIRLKTFPYSLLENLNLADSSFLHQFKSEFPTVIEKILTVRESF